MAAAAATVMKSLVHPFTHAQWKELETQAMIYKYMAASLSVPPDLLVPIIRSLSSHRSPHCSHYLFWNGLPLGHGSRTDGEPGRCKRTDGKKWRCSREVAPNQKYCDRHLHRGRPRSRKLVEVQANNGDASIFHNNCAKKTRSNGIMGLVSFSGRGGGDSLAQRDDRVPLIFPADDDNSSFLTLDSSYKETRDVDWMMIGDNPSFSAYNPFVFSSYLGSTDYNKGQIREFFDPALSSLTLSMDGANDSETGSRLVDSASSVTLAAGGGPLAEALGHGIASAPADPSSPNIAGNGNDEMDSSLTARTLASLSDSSGASNPRLAASAFTKSEFAVRWFSPQTT